MLSKLFKSVRHTRGHGVHSPFVYSLVRDVFMKRRLSPNGERELYQELVDGGVRRGVAVEIQELKSLYPHSSFRVLTLEADDGEVAEILKQGGEGTIVVLSARGAERRAELCRQAVERANCLSIHRRRYSLFFYDSRLPVQHFSL